ncbi:MAG TPA: iron-sulfur cluster insertion protein ErpA [Acidimicrobiales bacterium]
MITLTESAADKVRSLIESEGDAELSLRVAVRPGGCSGFSYEMFFDSDIASDDIKQDVNGVRVVVDPSSAEMLVGAVLDFKDGLQGAGFAIENPNAQRSCGCGKSFS